ncbi:ComEA family DNA-binding protein [Leucothrix mucor]|uniref:ComEA family DNA-binding protein n=1 Tax=Leucothrix mucor TaxID=45248 RepID=UPI0003B79110|nr:helix-hairpin-helix domain-containing protein [Leucothrix mucor]
MKSFLASLCILLSLMGAAQPLMAKDASTSTGAGKVDTKNAVVNLNKADANTLQYYLKGIGAVRSKAIIDHRNKNGAFKSVDDLLQVTGIGKATLSGIKSNLSLSRGEFTAPKVAASASSTKKTTSSASKTSSTDKASEKATASKGLKDSSSSTTATDTKSAKSSKDDSKADTKSAKTDSKATKTSSKETKSSTTSSSSKDKKAAKSKSKSSDKSKSTKSSAKSKKDSTKKKVLAADKKS